MAKLKQKQPVNMMSNRSVQTPSVPGPAQTAPSLSSTERSWDRALLLMAGILSLLYLVNCMSPLRLNVDTVRYLGIMECIQYGCPPDSDAAKDYFPYGYTALLLILSKLGILHSFSLILINCAYLFTTLLLMRRILGTGARTWVLTCILVLLNWTIIKFVTHPLSEMQYIFFSTSSLCCYIGYLEKRKALPLVLAFILSIPALLTRTIGIALPAALVAGLLWDNRASLLQLIRRHKAIFALSLLLPLSVIVFSRYLGLNHYTRVMSGKYQNDGVSRPEIVKWRLMEWGEITYNTSIAKVGSYVPFSAGNALFILSGLLFFAGFLYLLFFRTKNIPAVVRLYLLFYIVIMFNWPFYDPRFWVPVIPLIAGVVVTAVREIANTIVRRLFLLLLSVYTVFGLVGVGYMTYTSLTKETFARTHAKGVYRNEFETYFFGKPQSDTAKKVDPFILHLVRQYH